MAVILSDEGAGEFKMQIFELLDEAHGLITEADEVKYVLNNGTGDEFRRSYEAGKDATDKLSEVIDILIGQKKDLDKLINDLEAYLNSVIKFGRRLNQWTTTL